MFADFIADGQKLVTRLEVDLKRNRSAQPFATPAEVVSLKELSDWQSAMVASVKRTLGADPQSRIDYMWHLFKEEWTRARGPTNECLKTLHSVISYLSTLEARFNPSSFDRAFDWSLPLDPNAPSPELAEIEAKRWEFFRALVLDAQQRPLGQLDPLVTAQRIGLHEIHAREFFVSLVSSGHLNREWLIPEWQKLAREIDIEDQTGPARSKDNSANRCRLSVFLCHASEDKAAVRELRTMIEKWGHDPWLDEEKLLPGQDWDREIRRAIEHADVVAVCLSERSEKRGYVQKEIRRALDIADEQPEGAIFIIPIKLTECSVPDRLRQYQWVNLFSGSGPTKLEAALQLRAASVGQSRSGPTPA
jgi:hypothetical protein